jgi:hypothetical protein
MQQETSELGLDQVEAWNGLGLTTNQIVVESIAIFVYPVRMERET